MTRVSRAIGLGRGGWEGELHMVVSEVCSIQLGWGTGFEHEVYKGLVA